jgi:hypothetical protein
MPKPRAPKAKRPPAKKPAVKKPAAKKAAPRKPRVTKARIRSLVNRYVKRPFSAEQSRDISFANLEGRRLREDLSALKVRRKELRDQISAESLERAQTIAHENDQGRGLPKGPEGEEQKATTPYSLDASRKISGHELDIRRLNLKLADVEKNIRDTTASVREQARALDKTIDGAWEGPSLFDTAETTGEGETNPKGGGEGEPGDE